MLTMQYQNSHLQAGLRMAIHLEALSKILLLRDPFDEKTVALAKIEWERRCVESCIYHCAIGALYDSDICQSRTAQNILAKYPCYLRPPSPASSSNREALWEFTLKSPTLGAPPDIYLLLMDATRLARASRPLAIEHEVDIMSHYYRLREWELRLDAIEHQQAPNTALWMGKPYAVATRVLLMLSFVPDHIDLHGTFLKELETLLDEAKYVLQDLEKYFPRTWGKYLLWPLAIFGSASLDIECINTTRQLLSKVRLQSSCNTTIPICRLLEDKIWKRARPSRSQALSYRYEGVRMLLNSKEFLSRYQELEVSITGPPLSLPL